MIDWKLAKKLKIIGIVAKRGKEKVFIPCDKSKLYVEYNNQKQIFEISDMTKK